MSKLLGTDPLSESDADRILHEWLRLLHKRRDAAAGTRLGTDYSRLITLSTDAATLSARSVHNMRTALAAIPATREERISRIYSGVFPSQIDPLRDAAQRLVLILLDQRDPQMTIGEVLARDEPNLSEQEHAAVARQAHLVVHVQNIFHATGAMAMLVGQLVLISREVLFRVGFEDESSTDDIITKLSDALAILAEALLGAAIPEHVPLAAAVPVLISLLKSLLSPNDSVRTAAKVVAAVDDKLETVDAWSAAMTELDEWFCGLAAAMFKLLDVA